MQNEEVINSTLFVDEGYMRPLASSRKLFKKRRKKSGKLTFIEKRRFGKLKTDLSSS